MDQAERSDHLDEELLAEVLALLDDEVPDGLLQAVDLFRSAVPERVRDIDAALHQGRFADAARASHSLRGSAGAFGARRLSSLGEQLEHACLYSEQAPARVLLNEIQHEFEFFRGILDERVAEVTGHRAPRD